MRTETLANIDLTPAWWYIENKVLCLQAGEDDDVATFRVNHDQAVIALLGNILMGAPYSDRLNDVVEVCCHLYYDMHGGNTPISPATITATLYGLVFDLAHEQWKNEINLFNVVDISVLNFNRIQGHLTLYVMITQEI